MVQQPDGSWKQVGTHPYAMRGSAGADAPLSRDEQSLLGGIMDRYSAEQDPTKRAQIAQEYQLAQSRILLGRGRVPNLPGGMVNMPRVSDQQAPAMSFKDFAASYGSGNASKDMQAYQSFLLTTMSDEQLAQKLWAIPAGGGKAPPAKGGAGAEQGRFMESWRNKDGQVDLAAPVLGLGYAASDAFSALPDWYKRQVQLSREYDEQQGLRP
jgi:hypothetical protein